MNKTICAFAAIAAFACVSDAANAQFYPGRGYGPPPMVRPAPVFLPPPRFYPAPPRPAPVFIPPPQVFIPAPPAPVFVPPPVVPQPPYQQPSYEANDHYDDYRQRPQRNEEFGHQTDDQLLEKYGLSDDDFGNAADGPQQPATKPGVPQLSDENQIVIGCTQAFGVTKAAAACAIKGFTANEIRKCQAYGIGGNKGCFGKNNDLVKMAKRRFEQAARESTVAGQVLALSTNISLDDIKKNKDICGGKNSECNKAKRFLKGIGIKL